MTTVDTGEQIGAIETIRRGVSHSPELKEGFAVTLVIGDSAHRFLVSSLALVMALLVAQTRIEAGVHTTLEVASGGALGALVTLAVFQGFSG